MDYFSIKINQIKSIELKLNRMTIQATTTSQKHAIYSEYLVCLQK